MAVGVLPTVTSKLDRPEGTITMRVSTIGVRVETIWRLIPTFQIHAGAGMDVLLSIRYSDTWTNPEEQTPPADWTDLRGSTPEDAVYTYTSDVLGAFRAAGTLPDMVQIGNEITNGMLFPMGAVDNDEGWDALSGLLKSALRAVQEVDPGIFTVLHLDLIDQLEWATSWMNAALARNVQFDILAFSAYTRWHGEPAPWRENLLELSQRFPGHAFLVAQYANNEILVNQYMLDTPRGLGAFIWEPTTDGEWGDGLFDMPAGEGVAPPWDTLELFDDITRMAATQQ